MIFYFSATGNSAHVARRISAATGDTAASIEGASRAVELEGGEVLGIVAPTYGWSVPGIVERFVQGLELAGERPAYSFYLSTYGTTPGCSGRMAAGLFRDSLGFSPDALLSVRMPDTWTPIFDLSDAERVAQTNRAAESEIDEVCRIIAARKGTGRMPRQMPSFLAPAAKAYYRSMLSTEPFSVRGKCVGCGLCAKGCPAGAVKMRDGRPTWVKNSCEKCLRCLHLCPRFAIQHGKRTKAHGQYRHP